MNDFDKSLEALAEPSLDPMFWPAERIGVSSAWWEHVPFAHWIVAAARPNTLVELGTHGGVSYAAFCQGVQLAGLPTRCHAIDTWRGDSHAGEYGESVFEELNRYHETHFAAFSTLIRSTFDDALDYIEDGSVDLLHLDGLHTFDAVQHDYESWMPKLSDRAVVLLHDINERSKGFGVWRFWQMLCERHPNFTFLHGHGLGVLAVGENAPDAVLALCAINDPSRLAAVRRRFARVGERWLAETRERMVAERLAVVSDAAESREVLLQDALQARDTAVSQAAFEQAAADRALKDALQARDTAVSQAAFEQAAADRALKDALQARDTAVSQAASEQAAADRALKDALQARDTAVSQAASEQAAADRALKDALQARDTAVSQAASEQAAVAATRIQLQNALTRQAHAETTAAMLAANLDALLSSTTWLASWPLRRVGDASPLWIRRGLSRLITMWAVARPAQRAPASLPEPGPIQVALPVALPTALTFAERPQPALSPTRLLYISGEPETPGNAYRVERFVATAAELGLQASTMRVGEIAARRSEIEDATVLVLWRARWSADLEDAIAIARRVGARIVFDVDDLMIDPGHARLDVIDGIRSQALTEDAVSGHFGEIRATMLAADLCFTTTDELAYYMRGAGKTAHVMPNGFDQVIHDTSRAARLHWQRTKDDTFIRIGYAGGSRTHQRDFGLAVEAIARLLRENNACRLVLFRTSDGSESLIDVEEYPALAGLEDRIEWRPLQPLAKLGFEIARFDINLAPLEYGNPFCEAKSELKFWEAALVEVATVASPTGPFRRAITHGKTGFLAASADDWYVYLSRLASDPERRLCVARQAYHAALATFGPMQRALRFGRVIDQVHGGPAGARAFALEAQLATREPQLPKVFEYDIVFEQRGTTIAEVTVIVPLYNYAHYEVETLESVRWQTLDLLDLVMIDDCSTDDSLAVAKAWAERNKARFNRLVVLRNRSNYGLGFCRNSGFEAADTAYVLPLDADNRLLPECCETLLRAIRKSRTAFVYPSIQHFGDSSAIIGNRPYDPQGLVPGNYIDAMALIAKEAWAMAGGYDNVGGWEDYDLWCRFAELGLRGQWQPQVLAEYRVHQSSMTKRLTTIAENYRRLFENFSTRHPWVVLGEYHTSRQPPSPQLHLTAAAARSRLDVLLPILRCPTSKQKLSFNEARTALISVDGLRSWPILEGRPLLSPDIQASDIKSFDHMSNELPEVALDLIRATDGLVLNLSAGGSRHRFENVVEVEYAIFRHTDIVADAHELPFDDESFESIVVMNAFEHYREPHKVTAELYRILKPEGKVLIHTAFLQPQHERPWHFFNCTRYGLAEWFKSFKTETLHVSENFCPNHSIAWLASEAEAALRSDVSAASADAFARAPIGELVEIWRDPSRRDNPLWTNFQHLTQTSQEVTAAGFEFLGRKPKVNRVGFLEGSDP